MGTFFHILLQRKVRSFIILASGFYGFLVIVVRGEFGEQVMLCSSQVLFVMRSHHSSSTIKLLQINSLPSSVRSYKYFSLNVN